MRGAVGHHDLIEDPVDRGLDAVDDGLGEDAEEDDQQEKKIFQRDLVFVYRDVALQRFYNEIIQFYHSLFTIISSFTGQAGELIVCRRVDMTILPDQALIL